MQITNTEQFIIHLVEIIQIEMIKCEWNSVIISNLCHCNSLEVLSFLHHRMILALFRCEFSFHFLSKNIAGELNGIDDFSTPSFKMLTLKINNE